MRALLSPPITIRIRDDDTLLDTSIKSLELYPLPAGRSPDEALIASLGPRLKDSGGDQIANFTLRTLDLEAALREAASKAFRLPCKH